MRARSYCTLISLSALLVIPWSASAWSNGPAGHAFTREQAQCTNPPYSTHDWIPDQALALLPNEEKAWLIPHKATYLLGTEAPDNNRIPDSCNTPNSGYKDTGGGHSVDWNADHSKMIRTRAAVRAQEEYSKAVVAYQEDNFSAAAFYLGAMAHYIGDVSQYGHTIPDESWNIHKKYENWAKSRTLTFEAPTFRNYITLDTLVRRTPYTAVKRTSKVIARGKGKIIPAEQLDALYPVKGQNYVDSTGASLNLAVNELADVLHTFYLNVVTE